MIPEIGMLIGCYMVTRMAEIFAFDSQRAIDRRLVKVCAGGTFLFALYVMFSLYTRDSNIGERF